MRISKEILLLLAGLAAAGVAYANDDDENDVLQALNSKTGIEQTVSAIELGDIISNISAQVSIDYQSLEDEIEKNVKTLRQALRR